MTLRIAFSLQRTDDEIVYDGPHGPITVVPAPDAGHTAVVSPHGESTIAWTRATGDDRRLETDGVEVHVAGAPSGRLVRAGRVLELRRDDATVQAVVRRHLFRRMRLERADGTELASWRGERGRVHEVAGFADVTLMLLVLLSRLDRRLERRALPR